MVYLSSHLKERFPGFTLCLVESLKSNQIPITFLELTNDIWCRDFLPIQVGRNKFVQFSLTKDYYTKKLLHQKTDPYPICKELGIEPVTPIYNGLPIHLDGGNVIRKFNKVIITDKVFKDNDIPPVELKKILKDVLEVDQVIIIPKEPGEDSGHSDGMVRFVNENTVIVNDYESVDTNKRFVKKLYRTLQESGLDIINVPYNPRLDRLNGNQPSSGIYVNFLQCRDKIFLPTFNNPNVDSKSLSQFRELFGKDNVSPVPSVELSLWGGILNCISWEINETV
jgi:agmatine deiminase